MFDEELYKKEIYEKYSKEKNIDEKFDNLNNNTYRKFPIVAIIAVLCISITTFAYNEVINHKSKYVPEQTTKSVAEDIERDNFNVQHISGWTNLTRYEVIDSYEKYLEFKDEKNLELVEMDKSEFNDYFVIIIYSTRGKFKISDIYNKENKMYIELSKEGNDYEWISAKIEKYLYRDEIIIEIMPYLNNFSGYIPINEVPLDYSKSKAIEDGCATTGNMQLLDDYIIRTENGENGLSIRCVSFVGNELVEFSDIYYSDGVYYACIYQRYIYDEHKNNTTFITGNKIIKDEFSQLPSGWWYQLDSTTILY